MCSAFPAQLLLTAGASVLWLNLYLSFLLRLSDLRYLYFALPQLHPSHFAVPLLLHSAPSPPVRVHPSHCLIPSLPDFSHPPLSAMPHLPSHRKLYSSLSFPHNLPAHALTPAAALRLPALYFSSGNHFQAEAFWSGSAAHKSDLPDCPYQVQKEFLLPRCFLPYAHWPVQPEFLPLWQSLSRRLPPRFPMP